MADMYNVFISWSGPRSKAAAGALKEWLPLVVPTANPWMSATDIDKGTRWREEVAAALDTMKAGIICLTPENLTAEWLLFEAGALSKTRDPKTRVWTYLLSGLTVPDLTDPLAMFNATKAEEEDTRKLIHSINTNVDATVPENRVNRLFDKFWPDLKKELDAMPAPSGAAPPLGTVGVWASALRSCCSRRLLVRVSDCTKKYQNYSLTPDLSLRPRLACDAEHLKQPRALGRG